MDSGADQTTAPTPDDVSDYIDGIVADFNAATGDAKENIFAEQYFTTLYGRATGAWVYYRLTGFPTTSVAKLGSQSRSVPTNPVVPSE